ncbi:LLM class flavin-dependent oxidoreductase [Amycolatopsis sp. RM579]|uniref:LLM class flavin-dependent oxidoreductase n=2 Tax=Amycolatopsis pithecellobii TaxID=664692 RepID=A0A6N7YYR3_9PSEU|nr:LLM class flavin-dependent oxidoreductase [Amycolatopsis pithecellobii]MTD57038.1 LLM class flavin-dependent oxidoreductase [Amycolatopsis pithecellobii]
MLKIHWFLPTGGDARRLLDDGASQANRAGTRAGSFRAPTLEYLSSVARVVDGLGYESVLTPTGSQCEDAWVATAALLSGTSRLKYMVAFRPSQLSPVLAAQMAATYQRVSGGRLLLNVVTGSPDAEAHRYGDWYDKDQRYRQTGEFLAVMRGAWSGTPFDFQGEFFTVEKAATRYLPDPPPTVYFGGSSDQAARVAAKYVDVYLTWGEPVEAVKEKIDRLRALAAEEGRTLRFGIRMHVIARPDADSAWRQAESLLDGLSDDVIAKAQATLRGRGSEGQRRLLDLTGGSRDKLVVAPNLWAGVSLVRGGAGTALVGSYTEVADRMQEYRSVGIEEFVLGGYPHIEEAYWFAEGVMPELESRGLLSRADKLSSVA